MIRRQRITIIKIRKPVQQDVNEELQWFGSSLGLFGNRDKERSCFRVFVELLKSAKVNRALSSDELAIRTELTRGTVVFHLNKLMSAGLVIHDRGRYILRVGNLEAVVEEIQKDLNRTCDDLRRIAHDIDKNLKM